MRALEGFFASAKPDDLLLLHLSLHGWKDLRNRLHFVVRDTERGYLGSTAISAGFVGDRVTHSRSRQVVVLLDCCYSGAFTADMLRRAAGPPQVDVAEPFAGTGRVVLTASTALQFAHEGEPEVRSSWAAAQPSVFTAAVVEGLRDGSADLDGDGYVSAGELYDYVYDRVRQRVPGQTPTLSVDSAQAVIYLARSPRVVDGDLLAEMKAAVAERQAWRRIGALHLVERLLGSVREPTREAAREALLGLTRDADQEVALRARELWYGRGLGDIPTHGPARRVRQPRGTSSRPVVGIDFGTTNSAVGLLEGGDVRLVPNAEGALITPSLVAVTADGETLVGAAAKRQAVTNPEYTVRSVKLKLGTGWSIERGGIRYTAEGIAAIILSRLHSDAKAYLGCDIYGAVLTVPAYFDQVQRQALFEAAEIAGIPVRRIVNEPTAAAITYGLNRENEQTVLMFDLGGGTFDVSLLEIAEGVCEVRATAGDNHLGGDDWDQKIIDHLVHTVGTQHGVDIRHEAMALQRLKEAAEAAKIDLSSSTTTDIHLPYLAGTRDGPVHLDLTLARPRGASPSSRSSQPARSRATYPSPATARWRRCRRRANRHADSSALRCAACRSSSSAWSRSAATVARFGSSPVPTRCGQRAQLSR
jgi:molecular chaperone DnaK